MVKVLAPHVAHAAVLDKQLLRIRAVLLVYHQIHLVFIVVEQHIVQHTVAVQVALVDFAFLGACVVVIASYIIKDSAYIVVDKVGYAVRSGMPSLFKSAARVILMYESGIELPLIIQPSLSEGILSPQLPDSS